MIPFRIGHGYDVHRLVEGRALILGGVKSPMKKVSTDIQTLMFYFTP